MATIGNDPGGRRRILFVAADGSRRTIRLGKVDRKTAESVCRHVESLLAARIAAQPIDRQTAAWLASIGPALYDRLARAGLVEAREEGPRTTLAALVEEFLAARKDVKPGTMVNLRQATNKLLAFLPADKAVESVNEADAENYYRDMISRGLAVNTARRMAGRARELFTFAVRKRLIAVNPFTAVKVATSGNRDRQEYVPAETIAAVLDACPDAEWRLIVALSRFGGLRCPSEHLALTWECVNWERMRFRVDSPKTGPRVVPIFAELEPYLREAFDLAEAGQVHVITRNRNDGRQGNGITTNWRTQFLRIIKRAGVKPWPRLFHALRASAQTDLANRFPGHVVCSWLGNSEAVAAEHYLSVTEDHFRGAAQNPAQSGNVGSRQGPQPEPRQAEKQPVLRVVAEPDGSWQDGGMTLTGSEQAHDSQQETALHAERGTESGTLADVLALVELLTPDERAELLRVLAERDTQQ